MPLLQYFRKLQKLKLKDGNISFTNSKSLDWCKGVWLDEYVGIILKELHKEGIITDWAINLKVEKQGATNKLDGVFTRNNCLYLIECKTSNWKNTGVKTLYKIEAVLNAIGGALAK